MNKDYTTYTTGKGKHAYDVEAFVAGSAKERITFEVYASDRDQAARRVEKDGHRVCSVNMIG